MQFHTARYKENMLCKNDNTIHSASQARYSVYFRKEGSFSPFPAPINPIFRVPPIYHNILSSENAPNVLCYPNEYNA